MGEVVVLDNAMIDIRQVDRHGGRDAIEESAIDASYISIACNYHAILYLPSSILL